MLADEPTLQKINDFLWYGYLPIKSDTLIEKVFDDRDYCISYKKRLSEKTPDQLVKEGAEILQRAFDRHLASVKGEQVIPLSGGLDSRLILAHLLEAGLKKEIVAVTFGTPGTLDYEIPKKVARVAGVSHHSYDLTKIPISESNLINTAKKRKVWIELVTVFYLDEFKMNFDNSPAIWIGFLGDPIGGSHYKAGYQTLDWGRAKQEFVRFNRWCSALHPSLCQNGYIPSNSLPTLSIIDNPDLISYPDQLDFGIRQGTWLKAALDCSAPNVITPFLDFDWIRFMLLVPEPYRVNSNLYHKIMLFRFPKLFGIETKSISTGYLKKSASENVLVRLVTRLHRKSSLFSY
ncbi:asparagine synthase-related protein [Thiocapsa imhoffii]|uniref:asparagine synthase-related protein n=1 Tax=Thiocapsa imhoffii TaxID=382777 RepID=UPI001907FD84|nr:asparagine synthase-related protein [Thiocapsa imhoffii]